MKITELAIKRPLLFVVFYLIIAGLGILGYSKLRYELLPELATPVVTITAVYPGGSPAEIENTVSKKLEDAVSGVNKIKKVSTFSAENSSVISIEFLADANSEKAVQDVQRAVNKVLPELPSAVKSPTIESFSINSEPVLRVGTTANIAEEQLYELLDKQIRPNLSQIPNVGRVTLLGGSPREVKVVADLQKLKSYGVGIDQLTAAIANSNVEVPIGSIKANDAEFDIRTTGKARDFEQLRMQPVHVNGDGSTVFVKDVARIEEGKKEVKVINRINGKSSIGLLIDKQTGANAVEAAKLVRERLSKLESDNANIGLKFSIIQDSSEFTLKAANSVYFDFFVAVALVALVMLVFLHSLRNAVTVLIAIPTSLLVAFIMMYVMDFSLNLMTLLAMSLVIGILVDDSIVVLENIYRHMEMGKERVKASLDGRNEIGFAAMSITLVDVVVFLPLAFVPGLVGSLVQEFSLVIVVSTLSSLMVSFTLTPMISSRFSKLTHLDGKTAFSRFAMFFERQIEKLTKIYETVLAWSLKNRWKTVGISVLFLVASLSLVFTGHVGSEFVPPTDKGELSLLVTASPGTKIEEMDRMLKSIEAKISKVTEVTKQFSLVGYQSDGFNENRGGNYASINISLVDAKERSKSLSEVGRELKKIALQEAGAKVDVSTVGLFGTNGAPIQLLLYGANRDSVFAAGRQLLEQVKKIDGIVAPKLSVEELKPSLQVNIDRKKLGDLGLDIQSISNALRIAINGYEDMKFSKEGTEIDMRVSLGQKDKASVSDLENFSFVNAAGQPVLLKQFAEVKMATAPSILERRNKQSSVMLLAKVTGRPVGDVGEDIKAQVQKNPLPSSVTLSYEGDLDMQDDAFGSLGVALTMSIILIYLIMVALYNNWVYPFVVLFSIPVGVGGAVLALALADRSLNIFSIFGLIMMMGLVAKNAILLVDRANERMAEGDTLIEALMDAGRTRLRPILMTTLAMVIGMFPLAMSKGASAEMISSLAWVLIGGLTSSMFLTLVLVPVVHYGFTSMMQRTAKPKIVDISRATVLFMLLTFGALGAGAQTASPVKDTLLTLTIDQAVDMGLQHNRSIKLGELSTLKSEYATKEIQANLYPQLNATTTYVRNIKPSVFFFPTLATTPDGELAIDNSKLMAVQASAKNQFNGLVDLRLPIFNAELKEGIKLSRANTELTKADREVARWELADEIRKGYYNVLLAKLNKALVEKSIERTAQTLKDTRILYQNGMVLMSDTLNVFINLEGQKPNLFMADNQITQAKDYLKELLGISLESEIELTSNISESLTVDLLAGHKTQPTFMDRPDIRQNAAQQLAAQRQIDMDKKRGLPTLDFISQYQIQAQEDNFKFNNYNWPQSFYAGVQLNIPIFNGFRDKYKAKQSSVALQELRVNADQLASKAQLEYRKTQGDYKEAVNRIQVSKEMILAAEKSMELINGRYKKGLGRYQDVLDAQFNITQSTNSYNKAVYDAYIALAAQKKAIGIIR